VRLSIVTEPGAASGTACECRSALRELFGSGVVVNVEEVPFISPEPSGKFLLARRLFPLPDQRLLRREEYAHA
jgi:hypothetical protein